MMDDLIAQARPILDWLPWILGGVLVLGTSIGRRILRAVLVFTIVGWLIGDAVDRRGD